MPGSSRGKSAIKSTGGVVYEVELKYPLADRGPIEEVVGRLAARFHPPAEQVDRYFSHPCRDFARTDEALRLRREGDSVAITWKGPRIGDRGKTRREIELPLLPSPPTAGALATLADWTALLEALGFRQVAEVAKSRRKARVPWGGGEVEVVIDHVVGLGDFLELEILADEGGVSGALADLETFAVELGCDQPERRSYLEMLLVLAATQRH